MSVAVPEQAKQYIHVQRKFVPEGTDPFSTVEWKKANAIQINQKGEEIFRQDNVEVPAWWNETQVNVVAMQYFRKIKGVKENSARQVFHRVAFWLAVNGIKQGIFEGGLTVGEKGNLEGFLSPDAQAFYDELVYMGLHGMHAFNSPVWYNVGTEKDHQCSACFIQSAGDTMDQIMDLAKREVMLFKRGSGTGTNLSPLRSSYETLSSGGIASGPVSFMEGFDAWAGVTKSGGGTRRAAKMVVLGVSHPDILKQKNGKPGFITCKAHSEQLAHDLYSTGKYTAEFNVPGNVYELVPFQNANNSVRVTDEFMRAVLNDGDWETKAVKDGKTVHTYKAKEIWEEICKASWKCGDPGIQFDTSTNDWHTSKASGRINASNPCSEYLYLDDTACNLSSLNLRKFAKGKEFDLSGFVHASEIAITAKEIIVDASTYPSELLKTNSHKYRTLGLGYTNLGSLLTYWGLPYDSNEGRAVTSAITAIMGGTAYAQSARLAKVQGPFPAWSDSDGEHDNGYYMKQVIRKHLAAAKRIPTFIGPWQMLFDGAVDAWRDAVKYGDEWGYRNGQVTVLAPTGTISFMMGAVTTSGEPNLGVVTYKKLVGGGFMKLPNEDVAPALENLGYKAEAIDIILAHITQTGKIQTAPGFDASKHGAVFAEALGDNAITPEAHVDMMAAIQPFLSGGISKTVNMPKDCTWEDISRVYMRAWKNGIKCVAVYRDGCKLSQPISTSITDNSKKTKGLDWGKRKALPATRPSITHKFTVQGQEGYFTASTFPDTGAPAELFIRLAKTGSTLSGILDAWATNLSIALQYGAPFEVLKDKHIDMRFEPAGFTDDKDIPVAKSIPDYIFRWLDRTFGEKAKELKSITVTEGSAPVFPWDETKEMSKSLDGPPCSQCGNMTKRAGSCYCCTSCGTTTGCS